MLRASLLVLAALQCSGVVLPPAPFNLIETSFENFGYLTWPNGTLKSFVQQEYLYAGVTLCGDGDTHVCALSIRFVSDARFDYVVSSYQRSAVRAGAEVSQVFVQGDLMQNFFAPVWGKRHIFLSPPNTQPYLVDMANPAELHLKQVELRTARYFDEMEMGCFSPNDEHLALFVQGYLIVIDVAVTKKSGITYVIESHEISSSVHTCEFSTRTLHLVSPTAVYALGVSSHQRTKRFETAAHDHISALKIDTTSQRAYMVRHTPVLSAGKVEGGDERLEVFDTTSSPWTPLGSVSLNDWGRHKLRFGLTLLESGHLVVPGFQHMFTVDVRDPQAPTVSDYLPFYDQTMPTRVAVLKDTVYLPTSHGVRTLSIDRTGTQSIPHGEELDLPAWNCMHEGNSGLCKCPPGTALQSLWKQGGTSGLSSWRRFGCAAPTGTAAEGTCVEIFTGWLDTPGWARCPAGHALSGFRRWGCDDARCLTRLRCCQISRNGVTLQAGPTQTVDVSACMQPGHEGYCDLPQDSFITGLHYDATAPHADLRAIAKAEVTVLQGPQVKANRRPPLPVAVFDKDLPSTSVDIPREACVQQQYYRRCLCPEGHFLAPFQEQCSDISCLGKFVCKKPEHASVSTGECEDVETQWASSGWAWCPAGSVVQGFHHRGCQGLECVTHIRCCRLQDSASLLTVTGLPSGVTIRSDFYRMLGESVAGANPAIAGMHKADEGTGGCTGTSCISFALQ